MRFTLDAAVATYTTLVNPTRPIPHAVQRLTGISDATVRDAPHFNSVRAEVAEFIGDAAVVGHNVSFDLAFLAAEALEFPGPALDTLDLATLLDPTAGGYRLSALADRYGVAAPLQHRALADADLARQLFLVLDERLRALPPDLRRELLALAEPAGWSLATLLRDLLEEETPSRPTPAGRARPAPPAPREPEPPEGAAAAEKRPAALQRPDPAIWEAPDLAERVLAAGAGHPERFGAFERRDEQVGMLRAVADAVEAGRHLAVEAGTGTGKSLAYLIPTALHALREGEGVVVSTHTINLQEQLLANDVPVLRLLLRDVVGEEAAATLRVAPLKGRRNYLCLRRAEQERRGPAVPLREARLLGRILVWLRTTETGDRAELRVEQEEEEAWTRLSAEGEDCLAGGRCRFVRDGSCFLLRARRRAEQAHILVVNHALLLSDLAAGGTVLPRAGTVVIDEAHHLEDVATERLGARVSAASFHELLDAAQRSGARGAQAGLVAALAAAAGAVRALGATAAPVAQALHEDAAALARQTERARESIDPLFAALAAFVREQLGERYGEEQRLRVSGAQRAQPAWSRIEVLWEEAWTRLRALAEALASLEAPLLAAAGAGLREAEDLLGEALSLREALIERGAESGRLITELDPALVLWISSAPRRGTAQLSAAPLAIGPHLAEEFFSQRRCVILTGATLCSEARFDYLRERVGLAEADEARFGSPFDYRRAVQLLLPTDMPAPNERGYQSALEETLIDLAMASEGRALALFTSHAALRATAAGIRGPLEEAGILVLAQGLDGSPRRVLDALAQQAPAVVLGTASLWEGVDVPGPAVSLLVIARLPFAVPTDPVFAARSELYDDPFMRYALPQAIVRFRQGFGRLIRRRDDRGVVAVLDGRITGKGYGRAFVRSLPPVNVARLPLGGFGGATAAWLER